MDITSQHPRRLIVNADDFGLSRGVNRGIVMAHENGIVTSTSLMVRWPAAKEASAYARSQSKLSVGLHLDLGEWTFNNGAWEALYEVVPLDAPEQVEAEVKRQVAMFHDLCGRKPTHVDSHQHVHQRDALRPIVQPIVESIGVPLRHFAEHIRYCGSFYGQTTDGQPLPDLISSAALQRLAGELSPGITEICCHPAAEADLQTMYSHERLLELKALCDPSVRQAMAEQSIELCSFAEVTAERAIPSRG